MSQCEVTIRDRDLTLRCLRKAGHNSECKFAGE